MSNLEKCIIADLCDSISETYHRNSPNVVLINTSDVLEGNILNHAFVPNKQLKGQFKKTFQKDDILFSEIRPANKRYAFVDIENTQDYIVSTKLMVLRPNKKKVLPMYLYFLLTAKNMLDELQYLAETRSGTFPQITFDSELGTMPVTLPDMTTQAKIVSILKTIDDKIALNQQINKNLEKQIFSLYRETISTHDCSQIKLGNLCTFQEGYVNPPQGHAEYFDGSVKWLRAVDINESYIINTSRTLTQVGFDSAKKSALLFEPDTIAISKSGTIGRLGLLGDYMCGNRAVINIKPNDKALLTFLYAFLKSKQTDFSELAVGSVQKNLYVSLLEPLIVEIPSNEALASLCKRINSNLDMIKSNCFENNTLITLRDTLLPRLMSGEIDVSNIEC